MQFNDRRRKATVEVNNFPNENAVLGLYDEDINDDDVDSEDESSHFLKSRRHFEFSDGYSIMRVIRMITFIQIMAIMIDNPSYQISILFRIFSRGVLYYLSHFYSRPFLDFVYIIQYFLQEIITAIDSIPWPNTPNNVQVSTTRRLSTVSLFAIDFISPKNWHTINAYSHYFLGVLFVVMAFLFTFRFWEISDYTNRGEVRKWLQRYIADGWWRHGGLNVAISMAIGCIGLLCVCIVILFFASQFGRSATPDGRVVSAFLAIGISIVFIIWMIGYFGIRSTESVFERYVSQNVTYTSSMILKRAVKSKVEIGLMLISLMYLPVLYNLMASLTVVTDWNDTLATTFRRKVNYYVPCYYLAFLPYRDERLAVDTCPVASLISSSQTPRDTGFYSDAGILPCDSYLGVTIFVFGALMFLYLIIGYGYFYRAVIHQVTNEFKTSKEVIILEKLMRIREDEMEGYKERFTWTNRTAQAFRLEVEAQPVYWREGFIWFGKTSVDVFKGLIQFIISPFLLVWIPLKFFGERLLILSCFNFLTSEGKTNRMDNRRAMIERSNTNNDIKLANSASMKYGGDSMQRSGSMRGSVGGMGGQSLLRTKSGKELLSENSTMRGDGPQGLSLRIQQGLRQFYHRLNVIQPLFERIRTNIRQLRKSIIRSDTVVWMKVQYKLFIYHALHWSQKHNVSHSFNSLGGNHALWRIELTLQAKSRLLQRLSHHILVEFRSAKENFVAEHELVISFLDFTVDSAGLMMLSICYQYNRMYWFLIVLLELTILGILGPFLNLYTTWILRNVAFIIVIVIFGMISYLANPHTEDVDKWFEFTGRSMVVIFGVGSIICAILKPFAVNYIDISTAMYQPGPSLAYLATYATGSFGLYEVIDIIMVVFMFSYVLYVLYYVGFFGILDRYIKSIKYRYHDHLLDFLVAKLDEQTIGFENIFTGLELIQQWDDIIKSQQRYALLSWPDVRPPYLLSISHKLFEVKWAALFNLTLSNLRSSLGLTVLHTVMFSGSSEVARWLIHSNSELLHSTDFQQDTPLSIALKECAYFLLIYGQLNFGYRDDGTSYSDEAYTSYYPEIEDLREDIYLHGEFVQSNSETHNLNQKEITKIKEDFYFAFEMESTKDAKSLAEAAAGVRELSMLAKQQEEELKEIQANRLGLSKNNNTKELKLNPFDRKQLKQEEEKEALNRVEKLKRKKLREALELIRREKQSILAKRFPEDYLNENFESGMMNAWNVIGLQVTDECIYLDQKVMKRFKENENYDYHNDPIDLLEVGRMIGGRYGIEVNQDMKYVVPTGRYPVHIKYPKVIVPLNHGALDSHEYLDWDKKRRRPRNLENTGGSGRNASRAMSEVSYGSFAESAYSTGSGSTAMHRMLTLDPEAKKREVRWKICKYAEIFLSNEVAAYRHNIRWKSVEFKAFNRLASALQGKIAQSLALVCKLNPPDGYIRVSDWTMQITSSEYDLQPDENIPMIIKGVVTLIETADKVAKEAKRITAATFENVLGATTGNMTLAISKGRGRRKRSFSSRSQSSMSLYAPSGDGYSSRSFGPSTSRSNVQDKDKSSVRGSDDHDDQHGAEPGVEGQPDDEEKIHSTNQNTIIPERVIQYLAESMVASGNRLELSDSELSHNGRVGWRAIARALRAKYCSFILPSVLVSPKQVQIIQLILSRNELDCGDAVLVTDILRFQQQLVYVDLSFNRIGSRGMARMCKVLKNHASLTTFRMDHNNIGPACGKDVGIWLKTTTTLKILSMSHNHLGEIIRFPTFFSRQRIPSAIRDICTGLRYNRSLEIFDLSYNHLGESSADCLPNAVIHHPKLHTLGFSGNDLGKGGPKLIYALAGLSNGLQYAMQKEKFLMHIKQRQTMALQQKLKKLDHEVVDESQLGMLEQEANEEILHSVMDDGDMDENDSDLRMGTKSSPLVDVKDSDVFSTDGSNAIKSASNYSVVKGTSSPVGKKKKNENDTLSVDSLKSMELITLSKATRPRQLASLSLADNQLDGIYVGYSLAALLQRNKALTHLDLSGNSLGHGGANILTDELELCYGIKPREFVKLVLWNIEESKYSGRDAKPRKKIYTNLLSLNISRNGLGPNIVASLMYSLGHPHCTLTDLDISDNPLGQTIENGGNATLAADDIRYGISNSKSLLKLQMEKTAFEPEVMVTFLSGMAHNQVIMECSLKDIYLDEPSCLLLSTALKNCVELVKIDLNNCRMGAIGGKLVANSIRECTRRLVHVDLSGNLIGPVASLPIGDAIHDEHCALKTLLLGNNDLMEEGGNVIARQMIGNLSLTNIDLSNNYLTHKTALYLADAVRGLFQNGKKISDSPLRRIILNNNPEIGAKGAKLLLKAFANDRIEHLQLRNIGAKPGAANIISNAMRDPAITWEYLDASENSFSRMGLNQIFWAVRQNKRLRILKLSENKAGTLFCSNQDTLLKHGISVPKALRTNVLLRELDLSFNGLSSEAGINILDALIDNRTVKKLSLRGNILDDNVALMIPDLLRCNDVLEELDLGLNRLGFSCAYAVAESLEVNRSLKVLLLDYNRFGGAGVATLETFSRSIMMNYSLQVLVLDGNKLGPDWGIQLAETFARNNTLLQISLRDNRLDSRAGHALWKAYSHCPYLLELALSADEIGVQLWELFQNEFKRKRAFVSNDMLRAETELSKPQRQILAGYHD